MPGVYVAEIGAAPGLRESGVAVGDWVAQIDDQPCGHWDLPAVRQALAAADRPTVRFETRADRRPIEHRFPPGRLGIRLAAAVRSPNKSGESTSPPLPSGEGGFFWALAGLIGAVAGVLAVLPWATVELRAMEMGVWAAGQLCGAVLSVWQAVGPWEAAWVAGMERMEHSLVRARFEIRDSGMLPVHQLPWAPMQPDWRRVSWRSRADRFYKARWCSLVVWSVPDGRAGHWRGSRSVG